jgi:hypothetical protein
MSGSLAYGSSSSKRSWSTGAISPSIRGQKKKTQNRCMSDKRSGRGAQMSVMLLPRRKDPSLRSGIYRLATVPTASMRFGLATPLGSHRGGDRALCLH